MKMKKSAFHVYFLQILFNICPLFWIDIFYDNYTYLAGHGHFLFVLMWSISTCYGLYFYAKKIWENFKIPYQNKKHALICLGMILVVFIPYQKNSIFSDLHVCLFILCFSLYCFEWIQTYPLSDTKYKKICHFNCILILFCLTSFLMIGSMTAFTESIASFVLNLNLYYWAEKNPMEPSD